MKPVSSWIIRLALTVQFLAVLSVPVILAADDDGPRATWLVEWVRPYAFERTFGVLRLVDDTLSFNGQTGHDEWTIELADIKSISVIKTNDVRSLLIVKTDGDERIITFIDASLMPGSPKRAKATLDRALEAYAAAIR